MAAKKKNVRPQWRTYTDGATNVVVGAGCTFGPFLLTAILRHDEHKAHVTIADSNGDGAVYFQKEYKGVPSLDTLKMHAKREAHNWLTEIGYQLHLVPDA